MFFLGVMLLALWITGLAISYTMGGFIHALLVLAGVVFMSRAIRSGTSSRLVEIRHSSEVRSPMK